MVYSRARACWTGDCWEDVPSPNCVSIQEAQRQTWCVSGCEGVSESGAISLQQPRATAGTKSIGLSTGVTRQKNDELSV